MVLHFRVNESYVGIVGQLPQDMNEEFVKTYALVEDSDHVMVNATSGKF